MEDRSAARVYLKKGGEPSTFKVFCPERKNKMKFFVPGVKDEAQAQYIWEGTKKFAEETLLWKVTDRRIFSISYIDNRRNVTAEVGKPAPETGETVFVILESTTYLVCTANRGVRRGMPLLVGKHEVYAITDFEH